MCVCACVFAMRHAEGRGKRLELFMFIRDMKDVSSYILSYANLNIWHVPHFSICIGGAGIPHIFFYFSENQCQLLPQITNNIPNAEYNMRLICG